MRMVATPILPAVAVSLLAAVTMACAAAPAEIAAAVEDVDVVVVMEDIYFEPDRIEVAAGEPIEVLLVNEGGIVHDLVTDDWESGEIRPGRTGVVTASFSESVVAWCSIPGHRDAGMELEIVVSP